MVSYWQSKSNKGSSGVEDMVLLTKVNEDQIVDNLGKRMKDDLMFTYIGPVLICVNPFKQLPYFTQKDVEQYQGAASHENPPHIYALTDNMYRNMLIEGDNQCVIISGESGAGKTVCAKLIMGYIANISGGGKEVQKVKDIILESNPLLEAFGNAKTVRNNNSSRFGKYFEIQFSRAGSPDGGKISNFLLEKSRVVNQSKNERNFHIFYQICFGSNAAEQKNLGITSPDYFYYLKKSGCYKVDDVNDGDDFSHTKKAMDTVGISASTQNDIMKTVAGILHLGNISFVDDEKNPSQSMILNEQFLEFPAYLLEISTAVLKEKLTSRMMQTGGGNHRRGSLYNVPLNVEQAEFTRDALSKAIYSRLFDYLVQTINSAIVKQKQELSIGVLDIYGFEIFEENGFEQFCINFVNEKLQQIFIQLTLKSEQEEYISEGITWTPIDYFNNKIVCDLIESSRPPGIMCHLDDVCATMHAQAEGADAKFLQKTQASLSSHAHFNATNTCFTIQHYAGNVTYFADGFCEKNRDVLFRDLIQLMQSSKNAFICNLFPDDISQDDKKRPTTFGRKIRVQSEELVSTLMKCTPHYVRCIKPNETKKPYDFDTKRVLHQVRYLGLQENIRVRRAGFAYRQSFEKFLKRFAIITEKTWPQWRGSPPEGVKYILNSVNLDADQWQNGASKVFIKSPESLFLLEEMRERKYNSYAVRIQRAYRKWASVKYFIELKQKAGDILHGKKERKRASLNRNFVGDYIGILDNPSLRVLVGKREMVGFAVTVLKYDRRYKVQKRDIIITNQAFYMIGFEKVQKGAEKGKIQPVLKRRIELKLISSVSVSTRQDDFVVLHVPSEYDNLFATVLKTEFLVVLSEKYQALLGKKLLINFNDTIVYSVKKTTFDRKGSRTLSFHVGTSKFPVLKEKSGGAMVSIENGLPKDSIAGTCATFSTHRRKEEPLNGRKNPTGPRNVHPLNASTFPPHPRAAAPSSIAAPSPASPSNSAPTSAVSQPLPAGRRAPPPPPTSRGRPPPRPKPLVPMCKALYDYDAQDADELSFRVGDVIQIVTKDGDGWWKGKLNAAVGLFPSNYVEILN